MSSDDAAAAPASSHFIRQIIEDDLRTGATGGRVVTRFPPEPNGYLHIGHAKAICLNFGMASDYSGTCNVRFDDTNPETEDMEYVESISEDVRWLGFDPDTHRYFASDYFEQLFALAERLIEKGLAYVDSQTEEETRARRGTVTEPGIDSPFRSRSVAENLDLFRRMRAGEFPDGAHVLRAKIDMASTNMLLRDPVLYRIKHASHYRRGTSWCIFPLYDFAHPLSDAIEGITHSICTLEFDVHRPLYDWLVDHLFDAPRPHQYEFARLSLDYTLMSKRKLLQLVSGGHVQGWDDPRMPTIAGLRRRGIPASAIRRFCDLIGIAKADNRVDISLLEFAVRDELNAEAPRVMVVLDPLKVTLTNRTSDALEWLDASHWPHDIPREGSRPVPFGQTLYIERADFMEQPSKGFHRLSPGSEVRLRYAYIIRCDEVVKDEHGRVIEVRCSYDAETRSGGKAAGRRVKGTVHWVEATRAVPVEVRLYDRLFRVPDPEDVPEDGHFLDHLNPDSLTRIEGALAEPGLADAEAGDRFQFERQGYFFADPVDSKPGHPVFNRTMTLRDTWAKQTALSVTAQSVTPRPTKAAKNQVQSGPPIPDLSDAQEEDARVLESRYGIAFGDAALLTTEPPLRAFYESAAGHTDHPRTLANWVVHELQRVRKGQPLAEMAIAPKQLAELVNLVEDGTITGRVAKDVFAETVTTGRDPAVIVSDGNLGRIDDSQALRDAIEGVIAANPDKLIAFRGGKVGLIGFFVGQVMRATGGRADAVQVRTLLGEALSA